MLNSWFRKSWICFDKIWTTDLKSIPVCMVVMMFSPASSRYLIWSCTLEISIFSPCNRSRRSCRFGEFSWPQRSTSPILLPFPLLIFLPSIPSFHTFSGLLDAATFFIISSLIPGNMGSNGCVFCLLGIAKFILESPGRVLPLSAVPSIIEPMPLGPDMKRNPFPWNKR